MRTNLLSSNASLHIAIAAISKLSAISPFLETADCHVIGSRLFYFGSLIDKYRNFSYLICRVLTFTSMEASIAVYAISNCTAFMNS
jgi:hypothetical protein